MKVQSETTFRGYPTTATCVSRVQVSGCHIVRIETIHGASLPSIMYLHIVRNIYPIVVDPVGVNLHLTIRMSDSIIRQNSKDLLDFWMEKRFPSHDPYPSPIMTDLLGHPHKFLDLINRHIRFIRCIPT